MVSFKRVLRGAKVMKMGERSNMMEHCSDSLTKPHKLEGNRTCNRLVEGVA